MTQSQEEKENPFYNLEQFLDKRLQEKICLNKREYLTALVVQGLLGSPNWPIGTSKHVLVQEAIEYTDIIQRLLKESTARV